MDKKRRKEKAPKSKKKNKKPKDVHVGDFLDQKLQILISAHAQAKLS